MKWDNDVLEENDVLVSKRYCETTDDTCQDIQKFGSTVEFVSIMDEGKEALIDGLSYHLSSRYHFSIELM